MNEADPLQENLATVAAELLSSRQFQTALRCIFAAPAGAWQTVASCCADAYQLSELAAGVLADHAERFVVTHLPWPGLSPDDPYCMVLFVHDDKLWSTIALFNRASLKD